MKIFTTKLEQTNAIKLVEVEEILSRRREGLNRPGRQKKSTKIV